ncbi:MAG: Crp/Fnr family transcriptional regulator [Ruminococcaceae bacterium]|nr:Crp/Fnr family transcriptional regulator [Oscillospiraceae bacterium]
MDFQEMIKTPLLRGCSEENVREMLHQGAARIGLFEKREVICRAGDTVSEVGIVLDGSVQVENNDAWGGRSILNIVEAGGVFAEAYACLPDEPLLVSVVANTDCEILFLRVSQIFAGGGSCHTVLCRNLLTIAARKNVMLSQQMFLTSTKTIRERVTAYLAGQMAVQGSARLEIPFDRQQLADYLHVERSALSKELGKMRREGLLDFRKNRFTLYTRL